MTLSKLSQRGSKQSLVTWMIDVAVFCAQQHNNNNYHELSFALLKLSDQTSVHRKVWDSVISPAKGAAMDTLLMSRTRR